MSKRRYEIRDEEGVSLFTTSSLQLAEERLWTFGRPRQRTRGSKRLTARAVVLFDNEQQAIVTSMTVAQLWARHDANEAHIASLPSVRIRGLNA